MALASYILALFSPATGHTNGEVYNVKFVSRSTGYIWNNVSGALEADPAVANYSIVMTELGGDSGVFEVRVPANLPVGRYDYFITLHSGSPAVGDDVKDQQSFEKGEVFGF